ncbi:MAG: AIR synthase-related protein [Candidatus Bathyarchaeota archaeon]|nr:AIR synthase-related protein [Candidatus Bathyarchaeota archaeon]
MGHVLHTDSAGSKPIQAYLMYKETGDASWFRGLAQDALSMNINDVLCVGAEPVSFVDYIAYNPLSIDRVAMLGALAEGFAECKELLAREGSSVAFAGGETADLPDLLRTLDVCVTLYGRVKLSRVVSGDAVKPGDVIIGLRSGGKCRFEKGLNSGIMSNGHTLARTCLLSAKYLEKYPEISHPSRGRYTGRFELSDKPAGLGESVGEALLSPTRLFAPVASAVLRKVGEGVHGMVHNTGGGQTKCLRVGHGVKYVKDSLPEPDPIFHLIQREAAVEWREMYQDFNAGVGFEFIVDPDSAEETRRVAEGFGLGVQVIGRCEKSSGANTLEIRSPYGSFSYD